MTLFKTHFQSCCTITRGKCILYKKSIHFYSTVGGETLENIDQSSKKRKNQLKFNDNSKWHKVSVIKSGYETTLVVDRTRSSTHKGDITFNGENGRNGKTWKKRKSNVPENIGVDKVRS